MQHFIDDKYSQQENTLKKATLTFYPLQNDFPGSNSPILFGWVFCLFSYELQRCILLVIPGKKK